MNVARHFSAWQDLEPLRAMHGASHTAGDGHISGPNDSFNVRLLRDENRVPCGSANLPPAHGCAENRSIRDHPSTTLNER